MEGFFYYDNYLIINKNIQFGMVRQLICDILNSIFEDIRGVVLPGSKGKIY